MTIYLRKSTASQEILIGMLLDDDDGVTPKTGLTIANTDIKLWKHGGTTVGDKASGGATEISGGYYYATLDDTDTNTLGNLIIHVKVTDALMWRQECLVVSENFFDTMCSTDKLDVNVAELSGDSTAADNAESFFDGTGYAGTNNVIPLVTVTTTATNLTNANPSAATIADAVWDEASTGHTDAGKAGAQVWTDIDAILEDTSTTLDDLIDSEIGALTTELAKVPKSDSNVTWNATALASIQTECNDALIANNLDHLLLTPVNEDMTSQCADGTIFGRFLAGPDTSAFISTDCITDIHAAIVALAADVGDAGVGSSLVAVVTDILADTNELQTDWVNGGRLDLLLDGAASAGDPWSTALPGAYGAGTAGLLIGTTIPAAIDTIDNLLDTEITTLTTELAKVPKSDSTVTWNATALASINAEVDTALNTAIPGSPIADSINERIKAIDDLTQASGAGDLAAILTDTGTTLDGLIDDIKALVGGYSLSSPVFDTDGNMTSATITANGKTYTVTATYDVDTNLATYAIVVV